MSAQFGLSFDQAPPFSVPLRFFLSAPLFLLAAALLLLHAPEALESRWTPPALALTHALTLGYLAMVMAGALMQMLPVIAGSAMPVPVVIAWLVHPPLVAGTLALMAGFLTASAAGFAAAVALLATAFTALVGAAAIGLKGAARGATVAGMRLAVLSLGLTVALGLTLALARAEFSMPAPPGDSGAAHVAFGLLGWVLLLVIGVAFQVVPMLQITPPYPPALARWLAGSLFGLLCARAAAFLLPEPLDAAVLWLADSGLAAGALVFASVTLRLQAQRRRKLPDTTLNFWRLGMLALILCVAAWLAGTIWPAWRASEAYPLALGTVFVVGFAVSVVNGMLYKIVPFLAWFHLQAQLNAPVGSIPNMRQMMSERRLRAQFGLHLAACVLLAAAVFRPGVFAAPGGAALALSALLLWANLYSAVLRFRKHGGSWAATVRQRPRRPH